DGVADGRTPARAVPGQALGATARDRRRCPVPRLAGRLLCQRPHIGGRRRGFGDVSGVTRGGRHLSRKLWLLAVAALAFSLPVRAQTNDVSQTVAQWNASNATCRNGSTPALEAIGACEQRDRFSKLLALMNQCYGPTDKGGPAGWSACDAAKMAQDSALART